MKHKKDKDHKLTADARRTPRRRRPRSRPCSRRAVPLLPARSTPSCRRASARGPRPHLMRRRRSCTARQRMQRAACLGPQVGKANAGVSRLDQAQLSERARFDSVLCGCPPGNLDPRRAKRQHPAVEENEGFSSARLGGWGRRESWAYGVRGLWTTLPRKTSLEGLSRAPHCQLEPHQTLHTLHQSLQYVAARS